MQLVRHAGNESLRRNTSQFGDPIIITGEGTVISGLVPELNAAGREEGLRDMGTGKTREQEIQDTRFGNELKDAGTGI